MTAYRFVTKFLDFTAECAHFKTYSILAAPWSANVHICMRISSYLASYSSGLTGLETLLGKGERHLISGLELVSESLAGQDFVQVFVR